MNSIDTLIICNKLAEGHAKKIKNAQVVTYEGLEKWLLGRASFEQKAQFKTIYVDDRINLPEIMMRLSPYVNIMGADFRRF